MERRSLKREYELLQEIGKGVFGSVFIAKPISEKSRRLAKGSSTVAIKLVDMAQLAQAGQTDEGKHEIEILKLLQPECKKNNVVCFLDFFHDDGIGVVVMELATGDSLDKVCIQTGFSRGVPTDVLYLITREMLKALTYIHSLGLIHNDIKMANIMFDSETGDLTLVDIGAACLFESEKCGHGDYQTRSPELLKFGILGNNQDEISRNRNTASDVWALGLVLHILSSGVRPDHVTNRFSNEVVKLGSSFHRMTLTQNKEHSLPLLDTNTGDHTRNILNTVINQMVLVDWKQRNAAADDLAVVKRLDDEEPDNANTSSFESSGSYSAHIGSFGFEDDDESGSYGDIDELGYGSDWGI